MNIAGKSVLRTLCLAPLLLLCTGCPRGGGNAGQSGGQSQQSAVSTAPPLSVSLLCSDLGYADGYFVREADSALAALAKQHNWEYSLVGPLPTAEINQAGSFDVGLPWEDELLKGKPGLMHLSEAEALLAQVPDCDLLVITSPSVLDKALELAGRGELKARAVLLADDQGYNAPAQVPAIPVYRLSYEIKDVAFLCGVAAATSSNNAQFMILAAGDDPHAEEFLSGVTAGAQFTSAGAHCVTAIVPVDPDGLISPETFAESMQKVSQSAGQYFSPNHYILSLGRTTPSIMHALTKEPANGFVVTGYGDYRIVRPARVAGCALKLPSVAIAKVLGEYAAGRPLSELFADGVYPVGLQDGAVEMADYDEYSKYNKDGRDIEMRVEEARNLILAGELDVEY